MASFAKPSNLLSNDMDSKPATLIRFIAIVFEMGKQPHHEKSLVLRETE